MCYWLLVYFLLVEDLWFMDPMMVEKMFIIQNLISTRWWLMLEVRPSPTTRVPETIRFGQQPPRSEVLFFWSVFDLNCINDFRLALLNLDSHLVQGAEIYGPGDIEGHLGSDGNFYLIDFGRVCGPPFNHPLLALARSSCVNGFPTCRIPVKNLIRVFLEQGSRRNSNSLAC